MKQQLVDQYRQVLLGEFPVLDVRSPSEFATGAVPNAINIPILNDEEREKVGSTYKQRGASAAYEQGMKLVSAGIRTERVNAWLAFAEKNRDAVICCWRGGQRSEIAQTWLAEKGVCIPRVAGGSKALRQFCLDQLERLNRRAFVVLGGKTGVGKTLILSRYDCAIDLENLANHRGSAFGNTGSEQPPPISFEASLVSKLLKTERHPITLLEDEGRTIGRLGIPSGLYAQMQAAPMVAVTTSLAERVAFTYQSYVSSQNGQALLVSLEKIQRRLGGKRYKEVRELMSHAVETSDREQHLEWIEKLLVYYYDPQYEYQLARKRHRIMFEGEPFQVQEYLRDRYSIEPSPS